MTLLKFKDNDETSGEEMEEEESLITSIIDEESQFKTCRYCLEYVEDDRKYCKCTGSQGYIHYECLVRWYEFNNYKVINCELCNSPFNIKVCLDITRKSILNLIVLLFSCIMIIAVNVIFFYVIPKFVNIDKEYRNDFNALQYGVFLYSLILFMMVFKSYKQNRKYTLIHTSSS